MLQKDSTVVFTYGKACGLKRAYMAAIAENREVFEFEGRNYVQGYVKYLLQHIENQFGEPLNERFTEH